METAIGLGLSLALNVVLLFFVWRLRKKTRKTHITEEGIRMMVDAGGDNGSIDEIEKEMINNIFELGNISAGDIATHRTDIAAISLTASLDEISQVIAAEKYSRIVVFDENIDNVVGLLHVKDIVKYVLAEEGNHENFKIQDILMKPYFVPFSKKTDELFHEMQRDKVHMAIVIDEYGGTAGIVTMEDLIEEIVGNIFDEYDLEEEEEIYLLEENTYRISGIIDLEDVAEQLEMEFEGDEDYDTLGGYLIGRLGRIPEDGEKPELQIGGWLFQIEGIEEKRIEKVRATRIVKTENEEIIEQ